MAAAAGRTLVLPPKPVHHVTGVSSVAAAQAEVGGAADGDVTDGALEGEALADSALRPTSLTAAVTAVHAKLCRETTEEEHQQHLRTQSVFTCVRFVFLRALNT